MGDRIGANLDAAVVLADRLDLFDLAGTRTTAGSRFYAELNAPATTDSSVTKRLKEKSFARSVDRTYVTRGAEEWGVPLPDLVALVLAAQVPIADRIGLGGSPAADLPDFPAPPEPPAA